MMRAIRFTCILSSFCFNMIAANDVRLTGIGNHSPGSQVNSSDIDMNKPLTLLPSTINYLNIHGSQAYDLEDPVYLHQYYCDQNYMITAQAQTSSQDGYASIVAGAGAARRTSLKSRFHIAVGYPFPAQAASNLRMVIKCWSRIM